MEPASSLMCHLLTFKRFGVTRALNSGAGGSPGCTTPPYLPFQTHIGSPRVVLLSKRALRGLVELRFERKELTTDVAVLVRAATFCTFATPTVKPLALDCMKLGKIKAGTWAPAGAANRCDYDDDLTLASDGSVPRQQFWRRQAQACSFKSPSKRMDYCLDGSGGS